MLTQELTHKEIISRIIHHELGHWLMARHVGFEANEITVGMTKNRIYHGNALINPKPLIQFQQVNEIYNHLLNRTSVLCAGVIADIEWHTKYVSSDFNENDGRQYLYENGIMDATGLSDSAKIEELLYVMNGIKNPPSTVAEDIMNQRHDIRSEAWTKASDLIIDNPVLPVMGQILINDYFDNAKRTFDKCYLERIIQAIDC